MSANIFQKFFHPNNPQSEAPSPLPPKAEPLSFRWNWLCSNARRKKDITAEHTTTYGNILNGFLFFFLSLYVPLEAYVDFICFLVTVVDHIYINVIELNDRMVRAVIGMVVRAFKRRWSKLKCWEIIIL